MLSANRDILTVSLPSCIPQKRFITQLGACCGKRQSKHSAHPQPSSRYRHEL
jgi:hypothetical protein